MINNIVSLDFYNSHFYIKFENKEYYWNNLAKFISDTGFPYADTTRLLSYEPERNIYHVEKHTQEVLVGETLTELVWIKNNKKRLIPVIEQLIKSDIIVTTLEMTRAEKLAEVDWIVQRHQEQVALYIPTNITEEQYINLLYYKQQLRDLTKTQSKDTPTDQVEWPTNPLN